jgi:hypothetical protein
MTLSINLSPVTQGNFIASVVDNGEQLIAGVVVTGDEYKIVNISANFCKNLKWLQ